MIDREKVVREYEDYVNSYISLTTSNDYEFEMHKAVLALLKEKEAVKPIKTWELNNLSMAIDIYLCGNCKEKIVGIGKYCSYCGKPVLWEGR